MWIYIVLGSISIVLCIILVREYWLLWKVKKNLKKVIQERDALFIANKNLAECLKEDNEKIVELGERKRK